ncbi:MAG TPA: Ig-like domain-containing protein [Acidimicrobiia bacterium]|nr:Ig-like domain-containing protein [Acidimicrobiia bacterium]
MLTIVRVVVTLIALAFPAAALAGTSALQPFPTNLDTTFDPTQLTGLRVNLPEPDCATHPSDCADVAVLDHLDGFNIQPRIRIPFSGPIDPSTVSSSTVFLVPLSGHAHAIGINQPVWEPSTNTLYVESDDQLAQDTTYLLVVTRGIHDTHGNPIHAFGFGHTSIPGERAYDRLLVAALPFARAGGATPSEIADLSLFTTQSVTAISQTIRHQLLSAPAPAVDFDLGPAGSRTVFPDLPGLAVTWNRELSTTGPLSPAALPVAATQIFPGKIGTIAFGSYASPDYENADEVIPPVGTRTGEPAVQSVNHLQFTLFEPAGPPPHGGWPVAIFGHGFGDSKNGAPWVVASSLANAGIATIAINVVGHGFGPLGTYTVSEPGGAPVTFPAGGRGIDQDGNGTIDSTEGVSAVGAESLVSNSDGLRQTVIDLMQLVHVLHAGVDVDGDGSPDLSTSRIYYTGQSFGGIYGVELLGLEPTIRAGVTNVAGGPIVEIARLSPSFRPLVGLALISRTPSLYNAVPNSTLTNFDENMPLRNQPIVVDTVPGAAAIQDYLDNSEWAQQAGNPEGYAPYISMPIIFQFARGDQTVPNPTATRVIRAGNLAGRATLFRNDLAFAANPAVAKNPHTFLTNITGAGAPFAFAAQAQIATFFATDGAVTIDPDGPGPFFETPTSMLPEDLGFIP